MIDIFIIILTCLLLYIYFGYPLLLSFLARFFQKAHQVDENLDLNVSLVVSAYNEARVIKEKIENSLSLDYPADKLKIWIVSDASTDGTDDIVKSFQDNRVSLLRQSERKGKTEGLNQVLLRIKSDIVVFSDANAIYDAQALCKLVRHFADPTVGYAVGHARYFKGKSSSSDAGHSESVYWDMEVKVKKWESDFTSVVGGDGAIYAIRRELYQPLRPSDINDFVNPLQIVARGFRGVFDHEAFCFESPAGNFKKEFRRKVRIVNRSFNGILRVPQACNPAQVGWFAWQVISHKLLRWFTPFFLVLHFLLLLLATPKGGTWLLTLFFLLAYSAFAFLALLGGVRESRSLKSPPFFHLPYYFSLISLASIIGIGRRLAGETITTWGTVREGRADSPEQKNMSLLFLALMGVFVLSIWRFWWWIRK